MTDAAKTTASCAMINRHGEVVMWHARGDGVCYVSDSPLSLDWIGVAIAVGLIMIVILLGLRSIRWIASKFWREPRVNCTGAASLRREVSPFGGLSQRQSQNRSRCLRFDLRLDAGLPGSGNAAKEVKRTHMQAGAVTPFDLGSVLSGCARVRSPL